MEIIPSIDISKGKVVRLKRGKIEFAKYYGNPFYFLKRWQDEGADLIHIVDIDATLSLGRNLNVIKRLIRRARVPIQVGGGIRSKDLVDDLIDHGADRVVIGTLAFKDEEVTKELIQKYNEKIVIALDYVKEKVMKEGWLKEAKIGLEDAVIKFSKIGAKLFLVTCIQKDGMLSGVDFQTLNKICEVAKKNNSLVIASGGVTGIEDILKLRSLDVKGVIIGKALYEGLISIKEVKEALGCL
jgi:phosphoribosylformimino-5-aminoimidazole carboxamide ribotide isomerase